MHPSEVCEGLLPRVTGKPESWHFSELIRYSLIHTVLRGGRFSVDPLCILFYKVYIHYYYTLLLHIALRGVANFDPSRIMFYTVHPVFYPFTSGYSGWQIYTLHLCIYIYILFFQIISYPLLLEPSTYCLRGNGRFIQCSCVICTLC